jgi:hypothetical protein
MITEKKQVKNVGKKSKMVIEIEKIKKTEDNSTKIKGNKATKREEIMEELSDEISSDKCS